MARKAQKSEFQLSFADLMTAVDQKPGELFLLPFSANDFGGELVSILSAGLYTNPLDCIREYCQNSVDAGCETVTIKITGTTVSIFDDGQGMSLQDLVQARMFGLSPKDLRKHVGFRGIGIYSGFDLCRKLRITTTQKGDIRGHTMVFDFGGMKETLSAERFKPLSAGKSSLIDLLSKHTTIGRTRGDFPADRNFTLVELEEIGDQHIQLLSDRDKMQRYLLRNLPLDFDPTFEYREEINTKLAQQVPGFKAIKVRLESDNLPDVTVVKPGVPNLQAPLFAKVELDNGKLIAFYWYAITKEQQRIEPLKEESESAGLVYKVKGFTIGDRQKLYGAFLRKPQLYPWITGEVYVTDPDVVPNAERDDFENNRAKSTLDVLVPKSLKTAEDAVEKHQAYGVAIKRLNQYEPQLDKLEAAFESALITGPDVFRAYTDLDSLIRDLTRQKNSLEGTNKTRALNVLNRAKKLQEEFSKTAAEADPDPVSKTRSKSGQKRGKPTVKATEGAKPAQISKDLRSMVGDLNLPIDDMGLRILEAIQQTLDEVLSKGSPVYGTLINAIEARLVSMAEDE